MSRPKHYWWGYVKGMIRNYPCLVKKYGGQPASMLTTEGREYNAVMRAVATTEGYCNGEDRLKIIKLVLWDDSHTVAGAALALPCHEDTASKWHAEFIKLVATNYGLMDF